MILYQNDNSTIPYNCKMTLYNNFHFVHHFHRDYELIYVIEGSVEVTVEERTFTLHSGKFALILQNQIHGFETLKHSKVWVCVFAAEYVSEFHKLIGKKISEDNIFYPDSIQKELLLQKLIFSDTDRLEKCSYLTLACSVFMKQNPLIEGKEDYAKNLLHRMLGYVSDHFTENISLAKMSEDLGYEEHYLSRCFHSKFGKNFKHFINEYRVNYAKHLLSSEKKMTIAEIAYASGFQSLRSFNRSFLDIEGVSPRNFR